MKKIRMIVVSVLMILMCADTFADSYTDGIKKLIATNSLNFFSIDEFMKSVEEKMKESSVSVSKDNVENNVIELFIAPSYRENMSESEFNQMVEFCTDIEYKKIEDKLQKIVEEASQDESVTANLLAVLLLGQNPTYPPKIKSTAEFEAEIDKYFQILRIEDMVSFVGSMSMSAVDGSEVKTRVGNFWEVFVKHYKISVSNSLKKQVTLEELRKYNKIMDQPFYENKKKAESALIENFKAIIQQEIKRKNSQTIKK